MTKDPATTAFVAFCRTGDPHLLGRVFDRLAPELLLVAARLLPPRGDAPDVVQQTFVTALQTRKRFDGERAVAPWLVGILLQHVRHERRRLRRGLDAGRLRAPSTPGPVDAAISVELAERVRQSVAALSQPYRQVLQLHLVHGLTAAEVAASLERPFRSVQSQLRRGLQKLRGTLPKLAIAPWLPQFAALAEVRAHVLRAATAAVAGWLVLPWLRVAALVASVSLPAAMLVATAVTSEGPTAPVGASAVATVGTTVSEGSRPEQMPASLSRRVVRAADPPCRLRIAVVAAEDVTPLPGAVVTFTLHDRDAPEPARRRGLHPATTDAQGAAQIEIPRGPRIQLEIAIDAPGRLAVTGQFAVPDRDVWTIEGVALRKSVRGRVRVCDQHQVPVHGVVIVAGVPRLRGFSLRETPRASTGNDGWTDAIEWPEGEVLATLQRVPLEFASGDEAQLPMSLRDGTCALTLPRPDPDAVIAGRVLDEQGHPVPDARVRLARASDGARLTLSMGLRSDGDGRFVVPVPSGEQGPFKIAANVGRSDTQLSEQAYPRGSTDAVLRLRSPEGLVLTVVAAEDGTPIEAYAVMCFRVHYDRRGWITGDNTLRLGGHHPDGRVLVDGVEAGDNRLLVVPDDDAYLPSGFLPLRIGERATTFTVRLHRPAPIPVRVVDADGQPIAGSRVRLRARLADEAEPRFVDYRSAKYASSHWARWLDLAVATTDARGIAELPWQPWEETVAIRADGPGHVRREVELPRVVPGERPLELRVARGATLRGTVAHIERWPDLAVNNTGEKVPTDFARLHCRVALRNAADGVLETGPEGRSFAIAADGSFACEDVPPGRWQVMFEWRQPQAGGGAVTQQIGSALDEVVAISGREHEVRIDLARVLPGALRGRILLDGESVRAEGLGRGGRRIDHLGRVRSSGGFYWSEFVRPDSTYRMGGIPPGEVDLEVTIGGKSYRLLEPVSVAPGVDAQRDLHFRHLVARIRLQRADGTPVGPRLARLDGEVVEVDDAGWLTLDPLPTLRVQLELLPAGVTRRELYGMHFNDPRAQTCTLGAIDIDPTRAHSERTLTVPDGR